MGRRARFTIHQRKERGDYYVQVPLPGGDKHRIHGQSPEEVLDALQRYLKRGRDFPSSGPLSPDMRLEDYVMVYLERYRSNRELDGKTLRVYEQLLKGHVLPFNVEGRRLGAYKVREVKRRYLKALISAKKKAGYARDSVRLVRASISTVLSEAVDDELIGANPALRLLAKGGGKDARRRKSEAPEKVRAMDGETQQSFLDIVRSLTEEKPRKGHAWRRDNHAPIYSGLYVTLAKAGLRPSEAVVLLPIDIKFNRLTIRVTKAINDEGEPRDWTKTGLNRDVEISQELADELRVHMATVRSFFEKRERAVPAMLFPSEDGTYLDIHNVRRLFRQICDKAGIEGFTLYDLRHTYASLALMRGAPADWVQKQLGHESLWTTLRYYAHWIPKESRGRYAELLEQKPIAAEKTAQMVSTGTISAPNIGSKVIFVDNDKSVSLLE